MATPTASSTATAMPPLSFQLQHQVAIETFSTLFQHMKNFQDLVLLNFDPTQGLFIQTMDASKISVLEIRIDASWFSAFHCVQPVSIGVHSSLVYKILQARDKDASSKDKDKDKDKDTTTSTDDGITMTYDPTSSQGEVLFVSMKSSKAFDRHFEIPLVDLESDLISIPALEYEAEIALPSATFSNLISHLKHFGETLDIVCNENKVELISKSIDQGKMAVSIGIDDLDSFSIVEDCTLENSYSLANLAAMIGYGKLFPTMEIRMAREQPLLLELRTVTVVAGASAASDNPSSEQDADQDQTPPGVHIKYFLAPKISNDD